MNTRYLLFACFNYYPTGGMDDLEFEFNTYDEFVSKFANNDVREDEFQIYDKETSIVHKHHPKSYDNINNWETKQMIQRKDLFEWVKSVLP